MDVEELPLSYRIGAVMYMTDKLKAALITETKAWKLAFGKALGEKVSFSFWDVIAGSILLQLNLPALLQIYASPFSSVILNLVIRHVGRWEGNQVA